MRQILIAGLLALSATCAQAQGAADERENEALERAIEIIICEAPNPGPHLSLVCLVLQMEKAEREARIMAALRKQAEKELEDFKKKQKR